jgi:hypothetical protein
VIHHVFDRYNERKLKKKQNAHSNMHFKMPELLQRKKFLSIMCLPIHENCLVDAVQTPKPW